MDLLLPRTSTLRGFNPYGVVYVACSENLALCLYNGNLFREKNVYSNKIGPLVKKIKYRIVGKCFTKQSVVF